MYRRQEVGLETSQIGNYTDNHSCVCLTEYIACNCLMYFISFVENAYHAMLAHNGNQQAVNPKDELRKGQTFTKNFGAYIHERAKNRPRIQFVRSEVHNDRETALRSHAENL